MKFNYALSLEDLKNKMSYDELCTSTEKKYFDKDLVNKMVVDVDEEFDKIRNALTPMQNMLFKIQENTPKPKINYRHKT